MKKIFLFILTCLALAPLSGDGKEPKVEHQVRIDNEGSRSEARHGWLLIDGKALPDFFWTVVAAGKRYAFHQRKNHWGDDGYFPLNLPLAVEPSNEKLSKQDLALGFYKGEKKKSDTPTHWLYLQWTGGAGFCAPDRLNELIDFFEPAPISRSTTDIKELMGD